MEVTAPAPARRGRKARRFLAVSLAPTRRRPFSLTKQQVKLRSPLQSFVQVSKRSRYLSVFHLNLQGCQVLLPIHAAGNMIHYLSLSKADQN